MRGQPHEYVLYTWLFSTALFLGVVVYTGSFYDPDRNTAVAVLIGGIFAIVTAIVIIYLLVGLFVHVARRVHRFIQRTRSQTSTDTTASTHTKVFLLIDSSHG